MEANVRGAPGGIGGIPGFKLFFCQWAGTRQERLACLPFSSEGGFDGSSSLEGEVGAEPLVALKHKNRSSAKEH